MSEAQADPRVDDAPTAASPSRPVENATCDDDPAEAGKMTARAKARWAILRSALLGGKSDPSGCTGESKENSGCCAGGGGRLSINEASIRRFRGFRMIDRRVVEGGLRDFHREGLTGSTSEEWGDEYECAEYVIPLRPGGESLPLFYASSSPLTVRIRTRERKKRPRTKKVDVKALLSHRLHGVDNTGNVAVWDAESVLTHCLFRGVSTAGVSLPNDAPLGLKNVLSLATSHAVEEAEDNERRKVLRVVELGVGMAGLASLALSALTREESYCGTVSVDAVLTDGHPDCVANNEINVDLTTALHTRGFNDDGAVTDVRSRRLMWDSSSDGAVACASLVSESKGLFDLVLASDCTHFRDFHSSLLGTIGRLLRVGGWAVLCQPRRGRSLQQFVDVIHAVNGTVADKAEDVHKGGAGNAFLETGLLFEITLLDRLDDQIWEMHESFQSKDDGTYDADIHYPLLILLQKVRSYDEDIDTGKAVRHQEQRDSPK